MSGSRKQYSAVCLRDGLKIHESSCHNVYYAKLFVFLAQLASGFLNFRRRLGRPVISLSAMCFDKSSFMQELTRPILKRLLTDSVAVQT